MIIVRWLVGALAVMLVAYLVPGITVTSFISALLVALVLGFVNAVIRPILIFLTLPITILTLGLFVLVINALLFMLTAYFVPGFAVSGFGAAFLGSIVLAFLGWGINLVFSAEKKAVV